MWCTNNCSDANFEVGSCLEPGKGACSPKKVLDGDQTIIQWQNVWKLPKFCHPVEMEYPSAKEGWGTWARLATQNFVSVLVSQESVAIFIVRNSSITNSLEIGFDSPSSVNKVWTQRNYTSWVNVLILSSIRCEWHQKFGIYQHPRQTECTHFQIF
jgi:hypothetical protein